MAEVETGYVGEIDSSWKQNGLLNPQDAWRLNIPNEPPHPPGCHEVICPECSLTHNAHLSTCPECATR